MLRCIYGSETVIAIDSIQIVFYNVENLFDTNNNSETDDDEFTPSGERYWTEKKYHHKLNRIVQSIMAFSNFKTPELIALCEIENSKVLTDLLSVQLFKNLPYKYLHADSRDRRGVDVALLYDSTKVNPVFIEFIPIQFGSGKYTRDILYSKVNAMKDTLHLFINHWPSRYGGARETEPLRLKLADILMLKCDSILKQEYHAKIILLGDFNDEPQNKSIQKIMDYTRGNTDEKVFQNLLEGDKAFKGTIKYQGIWNLFDQFIVSSALLNNQSNVRVDRSEIANEDFLFEEDTRYLGRKPFRTYNGFKYIGGYSDHLPIKLVLQLIR